MNDANEIKKAYGKLCLCILVILCIVGIGAGIIIHSNTEHSIQLYRIEINRVVQELNRGTDNPDLTKYETIRSVEACGSLFGEKADQLVEDFTAETDQSTQSFANETDQSTQSFTNENDNSGENITEKINHFGAENHYVLKVVNGQLYKIEYDVDLSKERKIFRSMIFFIMAVSVIMILLILWYIYASIIRKFQTISDYPYELSKGNLTIPLKESRSKYFGRFLWGLDMLREKLEEEKQKNLELHKDKNVLLLSLSHDMKTPIAAIRLYASALKKNLYKSEEKQTEVATRIDENALELESYVARVIAASNDDFLEFEVKNGEFYLSNAIAQIKDYYYDKLLNVGTIFTIEDYTDLLLSGDEERFVEILQNIMENAIKYGDGETIKISFADEEDARLITISNSGCTLPEREAEHIFESFYRGSNAGNRPGNGLGLFICKKLIHRMGGEIFAEVEDQTMKVTTVMHR